MAQGEPGPGQQVGVRWVPPAAGFSIAALQPHSLHLFLEHLSKSSTFSLIDFTLWKNSLLKVAAVFHRILVFV